MTILFDAIHCQDNVEAWETLQRHGLPVPEHFNRANSLFNPLGEEPARGWFLLTRLGLNTLNLNSNSHTVTFSDDRGHQVSAHNLLIVQAQCLVPELRSNAPDSLYLVEVADGRYLLAHPLLGAAISKQYNVRAPAWGGLYYTRSAVATSRSADNISPGAVTITVDNGTNFGPAGEPLVVGSGASGEVTSITSVSSNSISCTTGMAHDGQKEKFWVQQPWSWTRMVEDIWNMMSSILGTFPGLPAPGDSLVPENWIFSGVNAWKALSLILKRLGCAVKCDLTRSQQQYSIVRVGSSDVNTQNLIGLADSQQLRLHHGDYLESILAKEPMGVRVYFHRMELFHGTEQTVTIQSSQWTSSAVHSEDVDNTNQGLTAPYYHPLWDDKPAVYDAQGNLINQNSLTTRATSRANDFFRMLRAPGGIRGHIIWSGPLPFSPGSELKGVSWRQDLHGIGDPEFPGGLVTEIVWHPFWDLRVTDAGRWDVYCPDGGASTKLQPPDFRPSYPVYPNLIEVVRIRSVPPDSDGLFDAELQLYNSESMSWIVKDAVWAIEGNGLKDQVKTGRYHARLIGHKKARPLYAFFICSLPGFLHSGLGPGAGSGAGSGGGDQFNCCTPGPDSLILTFAPCNGQAEQVTLIRNESNHEWFGTLCGQQIAFKCNSQLGSYTYDLEDANFGYIAAYIQSCNPFLWEAKGPGIVWTITE